VAVEKLMGQLEQFQGAAKDYRHQGIRLSPQGEKDMIPKHWLPDGKKNPETTSRLPPGVIIVPRGAAAWRLRGRFTALTE